MLSMKMSPTKHNTADSSNPTLTKLSIASDALQQLDSAMHKDSCLYGLGITDDDKNGKAAIQKRSLLDIDNASSLSLADKLRNEANKYSDENSAGREHYGTNKDALTSEYTDKKTGSPTTPTSPTNLYQPTVVASSTSATTLNSHTNERRPSWRLKLDAGCKVTFCVVLISCIVTGATRHSTIHLNSNCHDSAPMIAFTVSMQNWHMNCIHDSFEREIVWIPFLYLYIERIFQITKFFPNKLEG